MFHKSILCSILLWLLHSTATHAHGTNILSAHLLDWQAPNIKQVFSSSPFSTEVKHPRVDQVEGKTCMSGSFLNIDVDNDFAFDIDETVTVEIEFDLQRSSPDIVLNYDKNGEAAASKTLSLPQQHSSRWYRHRFTLERARFAERIVRHHNLSGDIAIADAKLLYAGAVSICDIRITRSSKSSLPPKQYGRLNLTVTLDGKPSPARIGIYDVTGRMPLPSADALLAKYRTLESRSIITPKSLGLPWSVNNPHSFYIDGQYQATLPVGRYDLVISRGPEYRLLKEAFDITSNGETTVSKALQRWIDMPAKGWYSGDTHIHYGRENVQDSRTIQLQMEAEDLHVASLLQMDDIGATDFHQYNWGKESYDNQAPYVLVSGQEGPRSHRGHTQHLNIDHPTHSSEQYYLYHHTFKTIREQGGVTGYAHVRDTHGFGSLFGLALDVPFDLIDFVEILQFAKLDLNIWFDFLNLGYKLSPGAGADVSPLTQNLPGTVRNYVHVPAPYTVQGWFDGLKNGHTFVSNGPLLELSINGKGMGETLALSRGETLHIEASAVLNPDIDQLQSLVLYQHGKIIAQTDSSKGAQSLQLNHKLPAEQGSWFVVKAIGKKHQQNVAVIAASAPVYVSVEGSGFCDPSAVPAIVDKLQSHLQTFLAAPLPPEQYDFPYSHQLEQEYWPKSLPLLQQRAEAVNQRYQAMVSLAGDGRCVD